MVFEGISPPFLFLNCQKLRRTMANQQITDVITHSGDRPPQWSERSRDKSNSPEGRGGCSLLGVCSSVNLNVPEGPCVTACSQRGPIGRW